MAVLYIIHVQRIPLGMTAQQRNKKQARPGKGAGANEVDKEQEVERSQTPNKAKPDLVGDFVTKYMKRKAN